MSLITREIARNSTSQYLVFQDKPVEEGPGTTAVPVIEGVEVCKEEVKDDPLHHRVHELILLLVCKPADFSDQVGDFGMRGRSEENGAGTVNHPDPIVVTEPAFVTGIIQGPGRDHGMQAQDEIRGEGFFCEGADRLHREVTVHDHPLVPVPGFSPGTEHLFCDLPAGGRPFEPGLMRWPPP